MPSEQPPALAPLLQPFSPLALQVRRVTGAVVGRPVELAAIQQELVTAGAGRLAAVTLEGEPGIGKTRLLLAASDIASAQGFTTIEPGGPAHRRAYQARQTTERCRSSPAKRAQGKSPRESR